MNVLRSPRACITSHIFGGEGGRETNKRESAQTTIHHHPSLTSCLLLRAHSGRQNLQNLSSVASEISHGKNYGKKQAWVYTSKQIRYHPSLTFCLLLRASTNPLQTHTHSTQHDTTQNEVFFLFFLFFLFLFSFSFFFNEYKQTNVTYNIYYI